MPDVGTEIPVKWLRYDLSRTSIMSSHNTFLDMNKLCSRWQTKVSQWLTLMRLAVTNDSWPLTKPFFYQIREISREFGVYTDQELRALLKFYHSLGKIIHFGTCCIDICFHKNMHPIPIFRTPTWGLDSSQEHNNLLPNSFQ